MKKLLALALCLLVGGLAVSPDLHGIPFGKKKDPERVAAVKELVTKKADAMIALSAAMLFVKKSIVATLPKGDTKTEALASLGGIKKVFTLGWKDAKKGADAATVARIGDSEFETKLGVLTGLVSKINAKAKQLDAARELFERAVTEDVNALIQTVKQQN